MRVLWIVNIELAALCRFLGKTAARGGGWLDGALANVRNASPELQIGVASMYSGHKLEHHQLDGMDFFRVPYRSRKKCDGRSRCFFQELYRIFQPDLIHIHGTEYPHSLSAAECAGEIPVVVSLQGVIDAYRPFALGGIPASTLLRYTTLRDVVRGNLPTAIAGDMKRRAVFEKQTLQKVSHVIGRTDWDRAHALHLNPQLNYHFCNETLRQEFYSGAQWRYEKCSRHSIFASNSSVPLKGMHQLIRAVALLREAYPDIRLVIAGEDILRGKGWKSALKRTGYSHYLRSLILKLGLRENVFFTGPLSAEQMQEQFLHGNLYVLPSAIENSPNTLGEAQLLGVPVVATDVGGVLSMVKHKENGLVCRYEDAIQMAYWIRTLFEDPALAEKLGENARRTASVRHDRTANAEMLLRIYQDIPAN